MHCSNNSFSDRGHLKIFGVNSITIDSFYSFRNPASIRRLHPTREWTRLTVDHIIVIFATRTSIYKTCWKWHGTSLVHPLQTTEIAFEAISLISILAVRSKKFSRVARVRHTLHSLGSLGTEGRTAKIDRSLRLLCWAIKTSLPLS